MCSSVSSPPPWLAEELPGASQHRIKPLVPFAALPVCCAVAMVTTTAECDSALPCRSELGQDGANSADGPILWNVSILRTLADLRSAYDDLANDPLWQFAMEGAKQGPRVEPATNEDLDPDDAIYELARIIQDEVTHYQEQWQQQENAMETMDPIEALLELAQLELNSHCI